jgi:hypothetical protein
LIQRASENMELDTALGNFKSRIWLLRSYVLYF